MCLNHRLSTANYSRSLISRFFIIPNSEKLSRRRWRSATICAIETYLLLIRLPLQHLFLRPLVPGRRREFPRPPTPRRSIRKSARKQARRITSTPTARNRQPQPSVSASHGTAPQNANSNETPSKRVLRSSTRRPAPADSPQNDSRFALPVVQTVPQPSDSSARLKTLSRARKRPPSSTARLVRDADNETAQSQKQSSLGVLQPKAQRSSGTRMTRQRSTPARAQGKPKIGGTTVVTNDPSNRPNPSSKGRERAPSSSTGAAAGKRSLNSRPVSAHAVTTVRARTLSMRPPRREASLSLSGQQLSLARGNRSRCDESIWTVQVLNGAGIAMRVRLACSQV